MFPFFAADLSQVWPEANQHFSKEIDDEANSYFQRIYNHPPHPTMSVDEVSALGQQLSPLQGLAVKMMVVIPPRVSSSGKVVKGQWPMLGIASVLG